MNTKLILTLIYFLSIGTTVQLQASETNLLPAFDGRSLCDVCWKKVNNAMLVPQRLVSLFLRQIVKERGLTSQIFQPSLKNYGLFLEIIEHK